MKIRVVLEMADNQQPIETDIEVPDAQYITSFGVKVPVNELGDLDWLLRFPVQLTGDLYVRWATHQENGE